MSRIAPILLALCLAPAIVSADDFYVFEQDLATEFMGNRFSGNGFDVAKNELHQLYARARGHARSAILRSGGVVLSVNLQEWGIADEDKAKVALTGWAVKDGRHSLVRRRGRMDVLFSVADGSTPVGAVAAARKLDPRSSVTVEVLAKRKARYGWLRTPPPSVELSLEELVAIRNAPLAVRRSGVGSLLRRAWGAALGGNDDDLETIEAKLRLNLRSLRYLDGSFHMTEGSTLSAKTTDLVLGRRGTPRDWFDRQLDRFQPLPEADEATAALLAGALRRSNSRWNASSASQEAWDRVRALRASDPTGLSDDDRAFLTRGETRSVGVAGRLGATE